MVEAQVFQIGSLIEFHPERPVRKVLVASDRMRSAVICLREGQALGEHAAPGEAVIHVLSGKVVLSLDGRDHRAGRGAVFHLPAGTPHAVRAEKDAVVQVVVALAEKNGHSAGP